MPEPITVWMVPLAHGVPPVEEEGTLALVGDVVVFTPARDDGTVTIACGTIERVKRHRVSPILQLSWSRDGQSHRAAFYFAPPPPLEPIVRSMPTTVREANAPKTSKRRQRRKNTVYLSTIAGDMKPTLAAWERDVRAAVRAARGS